MLSLRRLSASSAIVAITLFAAACASGAGGGPGEGPGGGGPGGGTGGRRGGPGTMGQMGMMANEDVPRDAATLALRFRNELALSDSQINAFSAIKTKLDAQAAPLRKQLDTLVVDPRAGANQSTDERTATQAKLRARAGVIRELREQAHEVKATVLLALNERQRTQMQVIEDAMKQDERPVMGPGGMGGGGMGGGRRGGGMGRPPA